MALDLNYYDVTGLSIYALVFRTTSEALEVGGGFTSYTDASLDDYDYPFSEVVGNSGTYSVTINESDLNLPGELQVQIWQRVGATPNKANDLLKNSASVFWNGIRALPGRIPPKLEGGGYLGTFDVPERISFNINAITDLGARYTTDDGRVNYRILNSEHSTIATGFVTATADGSGYFYRPSFTTSGYAVGQYRCETSGHIAHEIIRTTAYFNVATGIAVTAVADFNQVWAKLGVATGYVNDPSPTTTVFTTTLQSGNYAGQAFVLPDQYPGQGRIISSFESSNGQVTLNKGLTGLPSSGQLIIVLPIAGELGLS